MIDISEIRAQIKLLNPEINFDGAYTFYYDETNNIRKFRIKETGFNSAFTNNFVLGGLVFEGVSPDVQPLKDSLRLQSTAKEVKFNHIARGSFIDCLKSQNLNLFLKYLVSNNLYIHYSSINILYWSLVDIVDSAIVNSEISQKISAQFINVLKNDLYKLARLEINSMVSLFRKYEYPNIKQNRVLSFIEEMSELFFPYINEPEFHIGLESLRQILQECRRKGSLPFVMGEEDFILINDFSQFYMRPIYTFINSTHIFDKENSIEELLEKQIIMDGPRQINNYSFADSKSEQLIQLSDVVVGILGKLGSYCNTNDKEKIYSDMHSLNSLQEENIDLLLNLIAESRDRNMGFLHAIDCYEEMSKMDIIIECRQGICA
ncbi:DUF3800 domain-containing protein [Kangiella koreensis]|uniref:Uncharacterized protein n=1 Tax=Kangiella koreensis (strain DSM 16069 / JCM 12317 / KCTC 12182 / SW-125) TaxID=523791 RepID=C7R648_KANKD|nr:DUF3800 domain-containing protein [Kangiella koreensis]ACV25479.1 conserved hypothetical protein [Kangiella koreensis DSM 16069]